MHLESVDQMGSRIVLKQVPRRIISLVPSQTELLYDLGLHAEVIGVTKFCVHPLSWCKGKTIIGGTKNFWFDVIDALNPDLIVGNKEENYEEGIRSLKEKYPVWMSDIISLSDSTHMIESLGDLTGKAEEARNIHLEIDLAFQNLKRHKPLSVLYLIWKKPWMGAGAKTFVNTLIETMGLKNALGHKERYPVLTEVDINRMAPDLILLPSEPFPFQQHHQHELRNIVPNAKILQVDGEMFSWYGSRLVKAPAYFNSLRF